MRNPPLCSLDCCYEPDAVPPHYKCMWPNLLCEFDKLCHRYDKIVTKCPRIQRLAEPKWRISKYQAECFCGEIAFPKTNIVRTEKPVYTRTEQLSYPQVRSLVKLRNEPSFKCFSNQRKSNVNRLLRKSLLSVYSRLANLQQLEKIETPKKWTPRQRAKHMRYLRRLAKPKVYKRERGPARTGPDKPLRRYLRLSKPKKYPDLSPKEWTLTPGVAKFVPSPRLREIAKPRVYEKFDPEAAYAISPNALHYKASKRIKEMAVPAKMMFNKPEVRIDPYKVSPNALRYRLSKRIKELAEPKDYEDVHTRPEPYKVSPQALKAKATPRLIELAKPSRPVTKSK